MISPDQRSSTHVGGRRRRAVASLAVATLLAATSPAATTAFSPINSNLQAARPSTPCSERSAAAARSSLREFSLQIDANADERNGDVARPSAAAAASLLALAVSAAPLLSAPTPALAYEDSDYASETVTNVVARLKGAAGDVDKTFVTLEDVSKIITEGKGVGGTVTFDTGANLNGAVVADEDTTIYNPGLSLLTASEKERLVDAIIENRKVGLSTQRWSENNEYAFDFLKQKLDPLHMHELKGYLGILPFYGAVLYLGALFVQQNARGIFPLVYALCALGVFGPVFLLSAFGP